MRSLFTLLLILVPSFVLAASPTVSISSCDASEVIFTYTADNNPAITGATSDNLSADGVLFSGYQATSSSGTNVTKDFASEWGGSDNSDLFVIVYDNGSFASAECP